MSRKIRIFDTTLRDGEQSPGCSMDVGEKLDIARQLERLKVDVIEAGFAAASPGDLEAVRVVAREIKGCAVASLARCTAKDIDAAWEGLKHAADPLLHVFIATSPVHMEHKLRMPPGDVVERARETVRYARRFCPSVEFSCEDASRSRPEFLVRVLEAVIAEGAAILNIPDTVGYATPAEMHELITCLMQNTRGIEKVILSAHCHDDLGMAAANSISAVAAGAAQIECTINGIGERAGNAALEEVVMAIKTRGERLCAHTGVDTVMLYRASRMLQSITGLQIPPNKAIVGQNAFAHEAGIHQHGVLAERSTYEIMSPESVGMPKANMVLGKHSGRHGFEDRLLSLGYTLSQQEIDRAFEQFKLLADKKKDVTDRDIESLIFNEDVSGMGRITLGDFVINSGNTISATAKLSLAVDGVAKEYVAIGDGPVDAAFNAINQCAGMDITLEDYGIRSVTEGRDALGEAVVKLTAGGASAIGRGVSTDVIESSIKAYINGVNKLI